LLLCLVASCFFYAWWDWRFLFLLGGSTLTGYVCGRLIHEAAEETRRKLWLWTSIGLHLGVLGVFKYYNFFIDSLIDALALAGITVGIRTLEIILPVGISFYTFQTLSYTIDVYRRQIEPEPRLLNFSVFVSFFPQLVAGPIVRASTFLPQLRAPRPWDQERVILALEWILWGFFLKLCIADNAAVFVDSRYGDPDVYSPASLTLATVFFAFQIYGDFAGYSLIAIGIAKLLGFDFGRNFNRPYFATGFSDFWGRWHISLSSWLRDYVYIPLGGGRGGFWHGARNAAITMLLSGLWHGAGWTFLAWAALHALYLFAERVIGMVLTPRWWTRAAALPLVFALTCLAWVFFRAATMEEALTILQTILTWTAEPGASFGAQRLLAAKIACLIVFAVVADALSAREGVMRWYRGSLLLRAAGAGGLIAMIALTGAFGANQFIYFQF
ncbi:MAG: MBOAT family O-acyltransferase, partial [Pseudomonadota bacterium]